MLYAQVFDFNAYDAYTDGQVVEAQAQQYQGGAWAILTPWMAAGVVYQGAGVYACVFTLPDGAFVGLLAGRLQSVPNIIDSYPVNLPPAPVDVTTQFTDAPQTNTRFF